MRLLTSRCKSAVINCRTLRHCCTTPVIIVITAFIILTYRLSRSTSDLTPSASRTSRHGPTADHWSADSVAAVRQVLEGVDTEVTQNESDAREVEITDVVSEHSRSADYVGPEVIDQYERESPDGAAARSPPVSSEVRSSPCTNDDQEISRVSAVITVPVVQFQPAFNAAAAAVVTEYYTSVNYDVLVIHVTASTAHCRTEPRLGSIRGPARQSNFTLGLGVNRIDVFIVDTEELGVDGDERRVLNVYTFTIHRQSPPPPRTPPNSHLHRDFNACRLQQDCELQYLVNQSCGIQRTLFNSWTTFTHHVSTLPACPSGFEQGEWVLPCWDCSESSSCDWRHASWQPQHCAFHRPTATDLRQCLSGSKMLFLGDSTNRGIADYVTEILNGTLTQSHRTHDTRVDDNINSHSTAVAFAYYPQFWMSSEQRPLFEATLLQLLKITWPIKNSNKVVLVVGGVHWLSKQHLHVIANTLQRLQLSEVRVIVKSLGAGFHQHVDGLHHLTLMEQRRLVQHNWDLIQTANRLHFDVIDTFHMTMSRYKDFLQGKCACHFHRVKEVLPSFSEYLRSNTLPEQRETKMADMPIHYHVEGDINAAYSDILLAQLCPSVISSDRK